MLFLTQIKGIDLGVHEVYVKLRCGNTTVKTEKVKVKGAEHEFKEKFQFPVTNADQQQLHLTVKYVGNAVKFLDKTTSIATLGLVHSDFRIKASYLGEVLINLRDVQRSGRLVDEFPIILPEGKKSGPIKPKLFLNLAFRELSQAGASVFKSRSNLKIATPGHLIVDLIAGFNLLSADLNGLSDPFALLIVSGAEKKSNKQLKTLNPLWNERFEFEVTDFQKDSLLVKVFDWDRIGSDEPLGDVMIPLRSLQYELSKGRIEKEFKLEHTSTGSIRLGMEFFTTEGVLIAPPDPIKPRGSEIRSGTIEEETNEVKQQNQQETKSEQKIETISEDKNESEEAKAVEAQNHSEELKHEDHEINQSFNQDHKEAESVAHHSSLVDSTPSKSSAFPSHPTPVNLSLESSSAVDNSSSRPTHVRRYSPSESLRLPSTIHTDPNSLQGFLIIDVLGASNLPSNSADGTVDCYAKVQFGSTRVHTKVLKRTAEPRWNETFKIPLHAAELAHPEHENAILSVRVKVWHQFTPNQRVGGVEFRLSDLLDHVPSPQSIFNLLHPVTKKPTGSIVLTIRFEKLH